MIESLLTMSKSNKTDDLLISLRKIMRAVDLNSKQLVMQYGLTGPQVLLLKYIYEAGEEGIINSTLAKKASLSMATITSIIERLEKKSYVNKVRSNTDKRKIYLIATDACQNIMEKQPNLLQESFIQKFEMLKNWEQALLLSSFERVADMMGADSLDVAPILSSAEIEASHSL